MPEPQQPELARTRRRGDLEPEGKRKSREKTRGWSDTPDAYEPGGTAPIPEENRSGHRPEKDQDKPEGPPERPGRRTKK